ncbi:MAG: hypothetical protein NUW37_07700 [Planctomycetes bacterium]|nr:hypothetical protein [Planctomycetota bacterium]
MSDRIRKYSKPALTVIAVAALSLACSGKFELTPRERTEPAATLPMHSGPLKEFPEWCRRAERSKDALFVVSYAAIGDKVDDARSSAESSMRTSVKANLRAIAEKVLVEFGADEDALQIAAEEVAEAALGGLVIDRIVQVDEEKSPVGSVLAVHGYVPSETMAALLREKVNAILSSRTDANARSASDVDSLLGAILERNPQEEWTIDAEIQIASGIFPAWFLAGDRFPDCLHAAGCARFEEDKEHAADGSKVDAANEAAKNIEARVKTLSRDVLALFEKNFDDQVAFTDEQRSEIADATFERLAGKTILEESEMRDIDGNGKNDAVFVLVILSVDEFGSALRAEAYSRLEFVRQNREIAFAVLDKLISAVRYE